MTTTITTTIPTISTQDKIFEYFQNIKGTRMMSLTLNTEPKLRAPKSNPLAGRVRKIQKINGAVGYNYTNAVNRQRVKDGAPPDFEALARKNISHCGGATLKHDNTGQRYVFMRPVHKSDAIYYVDGKLTNIEEIREHLYFPPKKTNSSSQNVTKEVPYVNVKIENIVYYAG